MLSTFKFTKEMSLKDTVRLSVATQIKMSEMITHHLSDLIFQYGPTSVKGLVTNRLMEDLQSSGDIGRWNMLASLVADIFDMYTEIIKTIASDSMLMEKSLSDTVLEITKADVYHLPSTIKLVTTTLKSWPNPH